MLTLLIILLIIFVLFGGWGSTRSDIGYWGFSPVVVLLLVIVALALLGVF